MILCLVPFLGRFIVRRTSSKKEAAASWRIRYSSTVATSNVNGTAVTGPLNQQ